MRRVIGISQVSSVYHFLKPEFFRNNCRTTIDPVGGMRPTCFASSSARSFVRNGLLSRRTSLLSRVRVHGAGRGRPFYIPLYEGSDLNVWVDGGTAYGCLRQPRVHFFLGSILWSGRFLLRGRFLRLLLLLPRNCGLPIQFSCRYNR